MDGLFFNNSSVALREVTDGLSKTLMIGEALPEVVPCKTNHGEDRGSKDHWYIGGDDPDVNVDISEFCGSTGVPMNTSNELSFGSSHPGGCQGAMADGSVHYFAEGIDIEMWHRLGSRNDGKPIDGVF
jgi:prepilin-type processing-associated H-X9-DG protein